MLSKIKNEIYENKKYIYISYLISILTMIPQFVVSPPLNVSKHLILLFIVLLMLFAIPKFSKLLFSIFIIYLNLMNVVIGHIFIHWGYAHVDIGPRIEVAAESPKYETLEYLMTYIDYKDMLLGLYSFFVLVLLYKFLVHFKHSFKVIKFLGFIATISIIVAVSLHKNPVKESEPFNIPYQCIEAVNRVQLYDLRKKYLNSLKNISIESKKSIYDKIIIIQGEAVNKHHMSIYNYDKNTTPFLSTLKDQDNLYVFNGIAPTNQTRYSVPIFYTKANVQDFADLFSKSISIVSDFKNHQYKTYWISNQGRTAKHDSNIESMAQEADVKYFENERYENVKNDKVLLSYLDNMKINSRKEMYFIHLQGSHFKYSERYPNDIVLFRNATTIKEQYDNTIYYTDYILQNIFKYFKNKFHNKKILFVYTSDHGEVVSEDKHGHGYLPPFKDEYDIPFVIYSNIENDRIDELYQSNQKRYFNLENLNYMIEYISGINDDNNVSYSSDVFAIDPKNIFDYDKLEFYKD